VFLGFRLGREPTVVERRVSEHTVKVAGPDAVTHPASIPVAPAEWQSTPSRSDVAGYAGSADSRPKTNVG
jgi:hypothetical protein